MTTYHTAKVQGLEVFYREAGDPSNAKLLLLGGFPASSHQFRNLIPALADRFHVLSPDYPGFGNTDMPDPATRNYTFDHLAEIVDGLLTSVGDAGPMGIYMQDYGGPIGNRLIEKHPDWLQWQFIQNVAPQLRRVWQERCAAFRQLRRAGRPGDPARAGLSMTGRPAWSVRQGAGSR